MLNSSVSKKYSTPKSKNKLINYQNEIILIDYFFHKGVKDIIVYIPGLGCLKDDFYNAVKSKLLKNFSILSINLPGCGNSSYPKNYQLRINDLVEVIHIILSDYHKSKITVLGHSMGGVIGLLYCQKYGSKQKNKFISIEGTLDPNDCQFSKEVVYKGFTRFKQYLLPNFIEELEKSQYWSKRNYAKQLKLCSINALYDYHQTLVDYSIKDNLINVYLNLNIPKLFIYGSRSNHLNSLKSLKGNCLTKEIKNSGHFPHHDNSEDFYQSLNDFLNT